MSSPATNKSGKTPEKGAGNLANSPAAFPFGERLVRDLEAFHALPPAPYDACEKKAGRVSSQLLVRYRGTEYSVPTAYGHREVLIRGYVHEVVISCGAEVIARHSSSYEREDFVFNPLHT